MSDSLAAIRMTNIIQEVRDEHARQNKKWGEQNHPNGTGPDVILLRGRLLSKLVTMEAFANTARYTTDKAAEEGTLTYADILLEEVGEAFAEADPRSLRTELIQVAAVATAWVAKIDRDD